GATRAAHGLERGLSGISPCAEDEGTPARKIRRHQLRLSSYSCRQEGAQNWLSSSRGGHAGPVAVRHGDGRPRQPRDGRQLVQSRHAQSFKSPPGIVGVAPRVVRGRCAMARNSAGPSSGAASFPRGRRTPILARMPKPPKKPKKDPAKPTRAKAARPEQPAIEPALADLLNPGIGQGTAGPGSQTGLKPPPDNSFDRRADFAAAHRARKSTAQGLGEAPQAPYRSAAPLGELDPDLAKALGLHDDDSALPPAEGEQPAAKASPRAAFRGVTGATATVRALETLLREGRPE